MAFVAGAGGGGSPDNTTNNMTQYKQSRLHTYKRWKDRDSDIFFVPDLYFSGCDTSIYINNRHIVDVSNIFFSLRQNLKPIYGYKSYTYDKMAVGNRIIVGEFLIPFLKKNYLYNFLAAPEESGGGSTAPSGQIGAPNDLALSYLSARGIFDDDAVTETADMERKNIPAYIPDGLTDLDRVRLIQHGFDIYVSYGVRTTQDIAEVYANSTFTPDNSINDVLLRGVEAISGIHLRGHDKTISFNDTVYEKYEFIAKDLI